MRCCSTKLLRVNSRGVVPLGKAATTLAIYSKQLYVTKQILKKLAFKVSRWLDIFSG